MKHKILGIAVLLCAVFLAACSDLVDELTPKETYYRMEIPSDIENGKVSADKTSARAGDTVRLTLSANEGYKLNGQPTVKDADGTSVPVREITPGEVYEFTMPKSAVKVSAVFSPIPTSVTVTISESTGDFSLESEADGTKLTFTAVGTDSGANLVWKVYKGDTALDGAAYKQSGPDKAFSFDTGSLEGSYTLLVTSGTRSAAAVFTVNTTVNYTVKHLFEKVDGSGYEQNTSDYPDETEAGTAGEQTAASEKTVTGFTAQSVTQKTIAADGTTVVEIMYNRNLHTVTYEDGADDGDIAVPEDGTLYRYGQAVTVSFTGIGARPGYIFNSWSDGSTSYTSDGTKSFIMGDSPVTLTAQWTKIGTTFAVTISESTGDFSLESAAEGTKLTFTAVGTDSGANLVWKVYKGDKGDKGDTALADAAYKQSGQNTAFRFDTGSLEAGSYTLFVTSGTRSATAVFTVNTTVTVPVTLKTGGAINSILVSLCPDEYGEGSVCTKFARSDTNKASATLYLDTEEKYIPVWLVDTEVYYYVPDGCTPVMNEDSSKMFFLCTKLTSLDVKGFDTSNVTNMSNMFYYCSELTSLDVTGFDTSNVTDMSGMFSDCDALASLDVKGFDTSKVTNMSGMFFCCSGLASLDVTGFNTSNVTNMSYMFSWCSGLASLDVTGFDTSKVSNMRNMFFGCSGLNSLDVSKFVTSKVENMSGMFGSCSGLNSLDVSKFVTSKVTNMSKMFYNCSGLKSLDVTGFDTSNVTYMKEMFSGCSALTTIYATDKFVTTNVTNGDSCFNKCSNLEGGAGTAYDESKTSVTYARIDGGPDAPGYFTLKLIGSKSKPDAVGDIVFSDGSATPYTADLTLTVEQKSKAVAVIFYVGTECSNDSTSRTLGVGLAQNQSGLAWCLESAAAHDKNITTIQESDKDGSDNLSQIGEFLNGNNDTGTADNYPAFYFAKNYSGTATNLGETYADGWYLPSIAELQKIYDILTTVNNALDACDGTTFATSGAYWSSSQYASSDDKAYDFSFYFKDWRNLSKDFSYTFVCAVRAF